MNRYLAVLVLVTLVWGLTFPILKVATQSLSGVEISALRFLLAAACMAPFFWRVPRHAWRDGVVLGALALLSYVGQAYGLQFISSNRSAFLTSLNVIMVPLIAWALGIRPSGAVFLAALLACLGIGLMSFDGGSHFWADTATILCALAFAVYVLFLSGRSHLHQAHQLAAAQMGVMALLGTPFTNTFGSTETGMPPLSAGRLAPGGATRLAEPTVCMPIKSLLAMRST